MVCTNFRICRFKIEQNCLQMSAIINNTFKNNLFFGKTFIIAGGSSGIGSALAKHISELNGSLVLIGRDKKRLENVCNGLKKNNNQYHYIYDCDLGNFKKTYDLFLNIKKNHSKVDGLVWLAGSELIKQTALIDSNDIEKIFNVTVNGLMGSAKAFCSKNYWPDTGGSVVLASSVSSIRSSPGMLLYSAAKSAMSGATKSLSLELSKNKVRVNNIILGAVETEMHDRITKYYNQESINRYKDKHLFGFGKKEDVSGLIIYLLSDSSRWMTGSNIVFDGGLMVN